MLAALLALALAGEAAGSTLSSRLSRALESSGVSWSATGALVTNLKTGKVVYARGEASSLRPASNEKLPVGLAALDELGPRSRIPTQVLGLGEQEGTTWRGSLFLKGFGDPTLSQSDLADLAREVQAAGITRMTGRVLGDETFFDTRRTAPGWKPSFYKVWCPPLSALVVDRARVGQRTATNPARVAARAFKAALRSAGVAVPKKQVRVGVVPIEGELLAERLSPRVSAIVKRMNKESDNFYAEMLLKRLGGVEAGEGTTAAGARVVRRELRSRGVPLAGVRLADGSGLSLDNRLTARAIGGLLRSAWLDPGIRKPFYTSLARAGIDGTLRDRMKHPPARDRVRAKTGTTLHASALSGYVAGKYVFAVLQTGNPVPWTSTRQSQDRFAQILARRAT